MTRFLRWLDETFFSPPHRLDEVLRDVLLLTREPVEANRPRPSTPTQLAPTTDSPPLSS